MSEYGGKNNQLGNNHLQFHFVIKLAVENKTITCRKIGCMLSGAVVDSKDAAVDVMVSFPGAE